MNAEVKGPSGTDDHICIVGAENGRQWNRGGLGLSDSQSFGWHGGRKQTRPLRLCEDAGGSVAGHVEALVDEGPGLTVTLDMA